MTATALSEITALSEMPEMSKDLVTTELSNRVYAVTTDQPLSDKAYARVKADLNKAFEDRGIKPPIIIILSDGLKFQRLQ